MYFEDFPVGWVRTFDDTYLVTEEEIREVGERWDPQPFHVDPVAAADSVFGGLVASSVHLFAIATALGQVAAADPVAAVSALGFRNLTNHAPVRPGDVISKSQTVLEARLSNSRPGLGILRNRVELTNQRDEPVFSIEIAALYRCRPETG
jgi:acyl dehydratase